MKRKFILAALSILAAGQAYSATYTFNNGSGAATNGIADSLGRAFRGLTNPGDALGGTNGGISGGGGVVAVGFFSTDNLSEVTSGSSLLALFTAFPTSATTGAFTQGGGAGPRGVFSLGAPASQVAGSEFLGKNMYLLVGNGTTLANSTEFLVVKNTKTFDAADDGVATGVTVTFNAANSTVLLGSVLNDVRTTNGDTSVTPGWGTIVPIPEPSAALLGLLGAIGLIRRRR
mgnify:CR=1 FL=1